MLLINGTLRDPLLQQCDLRWLQRFVAIRRWHDLVRISAQDTLHQRAGLRMPRLHRLHAFDDRIGPVRNIQPQIGLPLFGIDAMAGKAVIAENRADIAIELQFACRLRGDGGAEPHSDSQGRKSKR